jgi:hypothetical protein
VFVGAGSVPRGARLPTAVRRRSIPTVPLWVPAAGAMATYESGGSVLTNTWRSTHNDAIADAFYSSKMRNAYSGTIAHPTWGDWGGLVLMGGGHANTNYAAVHIVTFAVSTMYFERVADTYDWAAADNNTGDITSELNSYGEVTATVGGTLKIASGHSYGNLVMANGRLERVMRQAYVYTGGGGDEAQAYHTLDLTNPATASSARSWVRQTDTLGGWSATNAPAFTAYAADQDRIYLMTRGSANLRWFDRATEAWVTGDNAGWGYPSADTDAGDPVTGVLFAVPERNLVVAAYRQSGNLVLQYIQTTASQPTVATATLGTSLALPVEGGKAVCWCSHSARILVFGVTSNTDKVYEVTIPATLTDTWTVDNHTISGGSIDPVSIMTRAGWGCQYHPQIRAVVLLHDLKHASSSPDTIDRVTVYRPRNT